MQIVTDINKLHIPCKPINKETNMRKLSDKINDAIKVMIDKKGCGIAANQVGIHKQFFVALIENEDKHQIKVFLNPNIISHSEETTDDIEGCLSFPNQYGTVTRWNEITIKYLSNTGWKQETYKGMDARIIQHEYDHLQGVCCMDKATDIHIKEPTAV